jgi:hypothetical protein
LWNLCTSGTIRLRTNIISDRKRNARYRTQQRTRYRYSNIDIVIRYGIFKDRCRHTILPSISMKNNRYLIC